MAQFTSIVEILKLLDKSNCRKCGEKSCMAFAALVLQGRLQLSDCPLLPHEVAKNHGIQQHKTLAMEEDFNRAVGELTAGLQAMDFKERAVRIGATYNNEALTVPIMGKPFTVDKKGKVKTDLHVNSWVLGSVLRYINFSQGIPVSSNWVPLRELPSGQDWYRLFGQQCEVVLKKTADSYADLFKDLVEMFGGEKLTTQFDSDIAVALYPLPLVPILICYWKPEEGMESSLGVFFDDTGEENLDIEGLYTLGVGIALMLEKMARQHGSQS